MKIEKLTAWAIIEFGRIRNVELAHAWAIDLDYVRTLQLEARMYATLAGARKREAIDAAQEIATLKSHAKFWKGERKALEDRAEGYRSLAEKRQADIQFINASHSERVRVLEGALRELDVNLENHQDSPFAQYQRRTIRKALRDTPIGLD